MTPRYSLAALAGLMCWLAMHHAFGDEFEWRNVIVRNRIDLIEQYLAEGGDPNQPVAAAGDRLPLQLAFSSRRQDAMLALLRAGADFELSGITVHTLAREGLTRVINFVLKEDPSLLVVEDNALGVASLSGYYDVVETLVEHNRRFNLSLGDSLNEAAEISLASYGGPAGHDDIARFLLEQGAPPIRRVLHAAALDSSPGMVRYLLRLGADPSLPLPQEETVRDNERTPIEFAWKRYSLDDPTSRAIARRIMFELTQAGAHLEDKDLDQIVVDGMEEVRRAGIEGGPDAELEMAAKLGYYDVVQHLLREHPIDGETLREVTMAALVADTDDVARLLLESGAPPDGGPLHMAARHSSPGMVRYLISLGADPNERYQERTALEHLWDGRAAQPQSFRLFYELLLSGADGCWLEKHKTEMHGLEWAVINSTAAECWPERWGGE